MNHCTIGGKPCSKCCEVIAIDGKDFEWMQEHSKDGRLESQYVQMLVPMTQQEALLRNPLMQERIDVVRKYKDEEVFFYSCNRLKNNRCSDYENRPSMCYNYPYRVDDSVYQSTAALAKRHYLTKEPAYTKGCTYLPEIIPVINI